MPAGIVWSVLLVDDDEAEVEVVRSCLFRPSAREYALHVEPDAVAAITALRRWTPDAILLRIDLGSPEAISAIPLINDAIHGALIIAIIHSDDRAHATSCVTVGAHDVITRNEINEVTLHRAIGYAIACKREQELHDLREIMHSLDNVPTHHTVTSVTSGSHGLGPLKQADKLLFRDLAENYSHLLLDYLQRSGQPKPEELRAGMQRLATRIGDAVGGARDMMDIHLAALPLIEELGVSPGGALTIFDSRVYAFEMMGMLVEYWRSGTRRRLYS